MSMAALEALVEQAGGVESLADYLEVPREVLENALAATEGEWTNRVSAMVEENTRKLLLMASQNGFFWRITRKRVVKDWLILSRWSETGHGTLRS